ncbi:hypothetical protein BJ322DRAFT_820664 [Thelephora terrestris]|uniref:Uncharacterized protein n=1 Tax=Thelephora terrestris TaxID=56493 RepID=A0A9P6HE28_9AGAM|nr:hypothetical protein BJ322DRAFT_820664 [Thelephora terrestris]
MSPPSLPPSPSPMFETSSSAGSSPAAFPVDSSPPSSPNSRDLDSFDEKEPEYLDPYAGSTHAKKRFPAYEKKPVTAAPLDTSSHNTTRYRALDDDSTTVGYAVSDTAFDGGSSLADDIDEVDEDGEGDASCDTINPELDTVSMKPHIAREKWERSIEDIIFKPEQVNEIDLNGSYIGYIPTSIIELNKVVLLSSESAYPGGSGGFLAPRSLLHRNFARASTTPDVIGKLSARESFTGRTGSLDRLKTSSFTTYLEKGPEIRLLLGACYLRSLPLELFQLERLTVLILRSNKLTHIPPQIKDLKNLQELDVSVNKLQYLPAELLQMQLFALNINVNPFLRNGSPVFLPLETRVGVSGPELAGESVTPTLRECCFRVLLRKVDGSDHTNLEAKYGSSQEVSVWKLSEAVRQVLNDCIPGSVSVGPRTKRQKLDEGYEEETRLGMGVCPSPHHEETSYFVEPVEVRYTWETRVAGKHLSTAVPVQWRGCCLGCLDFLEITPVGDTTTDESDPESLAPVSLNKSLNFSDDEW